MSPSTVERREEDKTYLTFKHLLQVADKKLFTSEYDWNEYDTKEELHIRRLRPGDSPENWVCVFVLEVFSDGCLAICDGEALGLISIIFI